MAHVGECSDTCDDTQRRQDEEGKMQKGPPCTGPACQLHVFPVLLCVSSADLSYIRRQCEKLQRLLP